MKELESGDVGIKDPGVGKLRNWRSRDLRIIIEEVGMWGLETWGTQM